MNIYASIGVVVGLMVGIILVVILFKFANSNHRVRTEYDERQKAIKGRAYMYAFYTIVAYEVIMLTLSIGEIKLPVADYILHFGGIMLGCTVLGAYCIWKDVYWGLNNNVRRYIIVFAGCILLNIFAVVSSVAHEGFLEKGKLGLPMLNLMVLFMMCVFLVEFAVKWVSGKREDNDAED